MPSGSSTVPRIPRGAAGSGVPGGGEVRYRFDGGAEVSVDLPYSGESYKGVVERVGRLDDPQDYIGLPSAIVRGDTGAVFARIKTPPAMPAALAGDPAIVTIDPDA